MSKLIKLKVCIKARVLKYPCVCLEISFLTYLIWWYLFPVPTPSFRAKSILPTLSQKSFKQRREMRFACRLANIIGPVVRGSYCFPTQNLMKKALHEITLNSQTKLNLFSPIVPSLATLQRHNIASPDAYWRWRRTFLRTSCVTV